MTLNLFRTFSPSLAIYLLNPLSMKAYYPMKFDIPHRGLSFTEYYPKHKVYHPGQDFNFGTGNDDHGADIINMMDGRVEYVAPIGKSNGGFGNFIIIEHPAYGVWSRHAHCDKILVKQNAKVKAGELIATCGNTGTIWSHDHCEIFGMNMYDIQSRHWRRFAYYPSGKSKAWVEANYYDVIKFIDKINMEASSHWSSQSMDWALEHGIITKSHNPSDNVTWGEYVVTMNRLAEKLIEWNNPK